MNTSVEFASGCPVEGVAGFGGFGVGALIRRPCNDAQHLSIPRLRLSRASGLRSSVARGRAQPPLCALTSNRPVRKELKTGP